MNTRKLLQRSWLYHKPTQASIYLQIRENGSVQGEGGTKKEICERVRVDGPCSAEKKGREDKKRGKKENNGGERERERERARERAEFLLTTGFKWMSNS